MFLEISQNSQENLCFRVSFLTKLKLFCNFIAITFECSPVNFGSTKRTSMSFNTKMLKQLYWNRTSAWVLSCKFATHFQNTFSQEHLWRAASEENVIQHLHVFDWHLLDQWNILNKQTVRKVKPVEMFCKNIKWENRQLFWYLYIDLINNGRCIRGS